MSATDHVLLPVKIFLTPTGEPTCAARYGHADGQCRFLRVEKLGTVQVCNETDETLETSKPDGEGYLVPGPKCPLWSKGEA